MPIYKFTCKACKSAPPRGQWPRSWRWKTQRGFDNHKCYANEVQLPPRSIHHPERDNGKSPDWLQDGEELFCPHCHDPFCYDGPQAASLHFPCPLCNAEIQFVRIGDWENETTEQVCSLCSSPMVERSGKYGVFWGCSAYSRANPCKGKAVTRSGFEFEDVLALERFEEDAERK